MGERERKREKEREREKEGERKIEKEGERAKDKMCTAAHTKSLDKTHLPFSTLWCISSWHIFAFACGAACVALQHPRLFENGEQVHWFVDYWGNIPQSVHAG